MPYYLPIVKISIIPSAVNMERICFSTFMRLACVCAVISLTWGGSEYVEPAAPYSSDASYGDDYKVASFLSVKTLYIFQMLSSFLWQKQIVNYEYAINDYYGNEQSKKETIDGDTAVGEYKTLLPDGKRQIVTYESGPYGHQANVAYEEGKSGDYYPAPAPAYEAPAPAYETPAPSYETPAYSEPSYDVVSVIKIAEYL